MQITSEKFYEIVGKRALYVAGLKALPMAHNNTKKHYCAPLELRSACTGECDTCILHIKGGVDWMVKNRNDTTRWGTNKWGLFGRILKQGVARRVEEVAKQRVEKPETNTLGENTERDAFDILLETFNG